MCSCHHQLLSVCPVQCIALSLTHTAILHVNLGKPAAMSVATDRQLGLPQATTARTAPNNTNYHG